MISDQPQALVASGKYLTVRIIPITLIAYLEFYSF